jgi:hypothetical protein
VPRTGLGLRYLPIIFSRALILAHVPRRVKRKFVFRPSFAYGGKCKAHGRSDLEVLAENIFCTLLSNLSIVVNQSKKVVDQNNVSDVLGFQLSGGESFKFLFENYDFTVFLFSPVKNRIRFVDHLLFWCKIVLKFKTKNLRK